jgi:alpha-glucosidase
VSRPMGLDVAVVAEGVYRAGLFREGRPPDYASPALADHPAAGEPAELDLMAVESAEIVDGRPRLVTRRAPGERFFACGERTSGLEKTGSHQVFWNIDPPSGHTAAFNNLYTSIPFVLSLREGAAYGLLFDNTGRVEIDLAKADPARVVYEASGGDLRFYVFRGPSVREVLDRYTALTGRTPMPPRWALGNQQSRWSYASADELRAIADGFRSRGIPCDVLYLDIDYMDGYRVFTWDAERFPDPAGLIAELADAGFRVVTIVDPGVKVDTAYPVYEEGRSRGFFCLTREGEEYNNEVWPGLCAFPDFTDPAVRAWWGARHEPLLDAGIAGVWCDMNEPALFVPRQSTMPGDVVHPGGGRARRHDEVHNAYGSYMAEATRSGLERLRPDRRPFVISRAGYAGLQRHALQWTGDNSSWWEHLWMGMPQLQNLGLSGIAWCGVDIGGFFGDCDGEMLARWTEFGAFQPFCRNHSALGTVAQEPWAFGEPWESICRDMLRLRMRLVPYLYTLFEECHRTGAPVLRPLLFEFPDDEVTYTADDQFMVGSALLVAPITRPGLEHRHVYLPAGTWCHWWTGEPFDGPAHILAHAPLGQPAVYARAGTPIPLGDPIEHTGLPSSLTWRVFSGGSGSASLYEDCGDGYGPWCRRTAHVEQGGRVSLSAREGAFVPARTSVVIEVVGVGSAEVEEAADPVVIERFENTD